MTYYFENVLELINGSVSLNLYFHMKNGDEQLVKFANLTDSNETNNATNQILDDFVNLLNSKIGEVTNENVINLSSADDRQNAVYKYDLEELPELLLKMEEVQSAPAGTFETFRHGVDSFSDVLGLIIVLGNAEENIVLYKQSYPISLLKRDKISITPIPHSTRLEKVSEDILRVDINVHFLLFDSIFYIFELAKLERITGYDGLIKAEAMKSIEVIRESKLLHDVQPLLDEIDNITFARKLTKIYADSKVLGNVNNEDIINFVSKHDYFKKSPIKIDEENKQLIIDTKVSKNSLVKLLNDDLLHSALTKSQYESIAKNDVVSQD